MMQILQPPGWARPKGFSNGFRVKEPLSSSRARSAGPARKWEARDFAGQFRQALANILAVLKEAKGRPEHIVRLTWYVLDKNEYLTH